MDRIDKLAAAAHRQIMTRRAAVAAAFSLLLSAPTVALVGGAIQADNAIARDLVLTAAHCVQPGANASVVERDDGRRPKMIRVASAERHPTFDLNTAVARGETADVALLKLAEPLSSQRLP